MAALASLRFPQLLVAACLAVACSSAPQLKRELAIVPGEPTTVRLLSTQGTLSLSLRNASAQQSKALYGADSGEIDPGSKVVDDVNLQTLLDVFAEKGMFANALQDVPRGARDVLAVDHGERRWVWAISGDRQARLAQQQQDGGAAERAFQEARAEFLSLYNSAEAFHGTGGKPIDFEAENRRVRSETPRVRSNGQPQGLR
jgi:hypothetical protein